MNREDWIIESAAARDRLRAQEQRELATHAIRQERRSIAERMTKDLQFSGAKHRRDQQDDSQSNAC